MRKRKIGWQKYEDIIESQINSPVLESIMNKYLSKYDLEDDVLIEDEQDEEVEDKSISSLVPIPLTDKMLEEISMLNNFECWMGHTNFDITPKIKDKLNKIEGVELLKIYSRYRFFIGVGRMFNFSDIRKDIDNSITTED